MAPAQSTTDLSKKTAQRMLWLSTIAFTLCFAVWTIFSIIGIEIRQELNLSEFEYGILIATPVLTGSIVRIILGVWTERYGGRLIYSLQMILTGIATLGLGYAHSYATFLLAALGVGLAGGSFIIGVAYVSKWFPESRQGTALGIFGMGNVGAALTTFAAPFFMLIGGWKFVANIWALAIIIMGIIFYLFAKDDPAFAERKAKGIKAPSLAEQFAPLKNLQAWRFSLYYFYVFGGFVALALWLPHYLVQVYDVDVRVAGIAAASFGLSASVFRMYGGVLSDRFGARAVMYWTFGFSLLFLFMLSYPPTDYVIHGVHGPISFSTQMGLWPFVITMFALGFFMSLGKAAVYRHIPVYYPKHVGSVGGLVGMIGGLGGFVLPIIFGALLEITGIWTAAFALLFLLVAVSLLWMHFSIRAMERRAHGEELDTLPSLPELKEIHDPKTTAMPRAIQDWNPEDPIFWAQQGRRIAQRNLWISIPALLLAFAVWMVWSVVVAQLPAIGFDFDQGQLFWLAALPALSGATLRIFYSFVVPIFGGRLWTTLSTASLLIPALGIGYAVQDPSTPYLIFVVLALLCGLGGGNFASSMANISFFFPRKEKGNALALNAGLGNLGVSVMQFLVPLVITAGVFGALGGEPQHLSDGQKVWIQNAGFIWVPLVMASTIAAWLGMNDIADAKSSFRDQAVIFGRAHNWIMCVLYVGTFGSFIGYSAGFPLLARLAFPDVDIIKFVFLGPLVGALSRAGTGWLADKVGGGRVTFWVFIGMILSVLLVVWSLQLNIFALFFLGFMLMFFFTGVGNASTFQMIPVIMRKEVARLFPNWSAEQQRPQAERESAAIIAFTSAIGAYGGFFIPKAFGTSIDLTGNAQAALWAFIAFYLLCLAMTWFFYTRKGGMLYEIERRPSATTAAPTAGSGSGSASTP